MNIKYIFLLLFCSFLALGLSAQTHHQKNALIIQNFAFAPLGKLALELEHRGYQLTTLDAEKNGDFLKQMDPLDYDLLIVLGGPISSNDSENHPYLLDEMNFLRIRDAHNLPSIGICLGSQLIARALGAKVMRGDKGNEFGLKFLNLTEDGEKSPFNVLKITPIMEAHNDVFSLPEGAVLLASTEQYPNQAFIHNKSLALQFHPEVDSEIVQKWMEIFNRNDNHNMKANLDKLDKEVLPKVIEFWHLWLDYLESSHV